MRITTKLLHPKSLTVALSLMCWVGLTGIANAAEDYLSQLNTRPSVKSAIASQSLLTALEVVGDKVVAVGDYGHIIISQDNGETWEQSEVPVQLLLTSVDFPTSEQGWAVGHEGVILHSGDAGKTWQLQYANPHKVRTEEELNQLSDEEFLKLPQEGSPLLDLWFRDEKEGFAVGAYGMFLHTEDGGQTWKNVADRIENYDGWHLNSITDNGNGIVYIAGEKGVLFRSDDFGDSWVTLESPYEGSYFGALPGYGADDIFIFGLQGNIFKSGDRGDSWHKVSSKASDGLMDGVILGENSVILVGNSGVILTSQDGGESFSMQVTPSRNALLAVERLSNDKLIMVGQGGVQLASPKTK